MKSSTRTWFILAITGFAIILLGQIIADRNGILWGLVIALSINCFVFLLSPQRLFSKFKTTELRGQDPWHALMIAKDLAFQARVPCPEVHVVNSTKVFAAIIGKSSDQAAILLSEGLLDRLTRDELKAVIAYEIAVSRQSSCFAMLVAAVFCDALYGLGQRLDKIYRWLLGLSAQKDGFFYHPFAYSFGLLCHALMRLLVSPQVYKKADNLASKYLSSPMRYAQVLWKVQSFAATQPDFSRASLAPLFMVNPLTKKAWYRYFQPQPNLEERLDSLIGQPSI